MNYVLQKRHEITKGKNKGKVIWKIVGYYSNIESLLKGYINLEIKDSNIKTLEELIIKLDELNKKIDDIRLEINLEENLKKVD